MIRRILPLCAVTFLVACGGGAEPAANPVEPTPVTAGAASASDSGTADAPSDGVPAALQFTAPLVGGGEIELGEYAGRPVLLWFWAPW